MDIKNALVFSPPQQIFLVLTSKQTQTNFEIYFSQLTDVFVQITEYIYKRIDVMFHPTLLFPEVVFHHQRQIVQRKPFLGPRQIYPKHQLFCKISSSKSTLIPIFLSWSSGVKEMFSVLSSFSEKAKQLYYDMKHSFVKGIIDF